MRAKLICNPSLYSSAEAVFEEVKNNLPTSSRHIIIVPERYTLISEKQLLKVLGVKCTFNCEVISINRLCNRAMGIGEILDKQGGIILIQKILQQKQNELKFFGSMQTKLGFAQNVYQTLMQFKSSGVKPEMVAAKTGNTMLDNKMQDLKLIYQEYEKYIENGLTDSIKKLKELCSQVKTNAFFKDASFYFAYFESFTCNDYMFVKALIEHNNPCVIGCRYCESSGNEHIFTNSIYYQLQPLFFEKGLTDIVQYQCVLPGIKEHIKNNLYAFQPQTQIVPNESVQIFSCKNQTQEVQNVLKRIYYLIARLGYRYKDINVAFSSLDGYKEILERELASYNFSYYIDSSTSLLSTELGRFVTTMLEALEYNFMSTDVFALLNNYYFDMTSNEKDFLNCVISKYNLQGINWLTNTKLFKNDTYITNLAKDINIDYEQTLEKFYKKLQDIQNIFKNCKTSSDFVSIIKQAIQNFDIDSMHEKLMQSNQNNINNLKILEQVLPKLQQILQQIEDLDVDIEYTYAEFSRLLKESLDACKINLVPLSIDAIYFGDATASTFEKRKFMIIVGANYGQLPQIKQDVGLVSDREVDMLQEKYKLEPKVSDVNMRARLKAYELCLFGTEGLIIYYPLVTDGGEEMHISPMVQSLMQCLCVKENTPLCIINSDDLWSYSAIGDADVLMRMCGNTQSAEQFVLENLALASEKNFASIYTALKDVSNICKYLQITEQKFIKPNIKNLDFYAFNGENDKKCAKFSVTQLATYFDCPYKHFVERALKIQQLQGANLDQLDIGTILHKYAELFEKELMQNKASFSAEELEKVKEQIHTEALKEYSGKLNLESNEIVAKRLQKEGEALINKLNEQYDISEFKTDKCEYGFDNYPFHKGKREYLLSGKIDRIDKWQDNVVLLDYKTGNISLKFADIYYGKKLQLLLYANAVKESLGNLHISGFGYYPIHDKYNREDDSKNNVIDGYFEKNDDIITRLDKNLFTSEEGVSTKSNMYSISRRINKGDKNTKYSSNVIDTTDLLALCDYASKVAKQALSEIEEGYIEPKPIIDGQKSPCEYCPFLSICNKELFALERVEEKITLQNIKEAMQNVQTNA